MTPSAHYTSDAWLLRGISSLPGTLALSRGRLSFVAHGTGSFWRFQLRKLAEQTGQAGLAQHLAEAAPVTLFAVPVAAIDELRFPWYTFSGGLDVTLNGVRYRFGFDRPANTELSNDTAQAINEIGQARRTGKAWKAVLNRRRGE